MGGNISPNCLSIESFLYLCPLPSWNTRVSWNATGEHVPLKLSTCHSTRQQLDYAPGKARCLPYTAQTTLPISRRHQSKIFSCLFILMTGFLMPVCSSWRGSHELYWPIWHLQKQQLKLDISTLVLSKLYLEISQKNPKRLAFWKFLMLQSPVPGNYVLKSFFKWIHSTSRKAAIKPNNCGNS